MKFDTHERRGLAQVIAAASLSLVVSCGGSATSVGQSGAPTPAFQVSETADLLSQLELGPFASPHSGTRLVEVYDHSDGETTTATYHELVAVDSQGDFSVVPLHANSPGLDNEIFLGQLEQHVGFHFRYRDFLIRDVNAFTSNFTLIADSSTTVPFLDRDCIEVLVEPSGSTGARHDLLVDAETGLVVASQTVDAISGELIMRTSFVTLSIGEPAEFEPFSAGNQEQAVDLSQPLAEQVGFAPTLPSYLPDGFVVSTASKVVDPLGVEWFLLTCTNGVDPLFVLQQAGTLAGSPGVWIDPDQIDGAPVASELVYFQNGNVTAMYGNVDGGRRMVVGVGSLLDLQLTLESTLF